MRAEWGGFMVGLALAAMTAAQLPATGMRTDVMQTSAGELRITPLHGPSFLLDWAARLIYVDPQQAVDFKGWPEADMVLFTAKPNAAEQGALTGLRKASTVVLEPGEIAPGQDRQITLAGMGSALSITVRGMAQEEGGGEGYVLQMGKRRILITGDTACNAGATSGLPINVAFVALDHGTPAATATCIRQMHPKVVYPYLAPDGSGQRVQSFLVGVKGIEVRLRDWGR